MNALVNRVHPAVLKATIALLLAVTWVIPAWNKLSGGGVPPFFTERFGGTFLASFPGIPASFYSIAILEAVAGLLALASLASGEFLRSGTPLLKAGVLLSGLVFVQLGFGLRLVGDNDGAASLFAYTVGALVMALVVDALERRPREEAAGS